MAVAKPDCGDTWGSPLAAIKAALKAPGMGHTPHEAIGLVVLDKFMDVSDPLDEHEFLDVCKDVATELGVILERYTYPVGSCMMYRYHAKPKEDPDVG